ncbi:MAG TPA: glycosyltransferase family 4 protein [Thermomicrobiaceae bacterium]|nr:glycosyltransferase family 4 protein [Thermomicrobiaceae bacterium]
MSGLQVLVVTSFPYPHVGGAGTVVGALASRLQAAGRLAGLISGDRVPPALAQRFIYPPFRVALADRARAWKLGASVDRLAAAIRRRSDLSGGLIVHSHDPAATCASLRAVPPGVPVVQTVHGPWSREARAAGVDPGSRFLAALTALEAGAYRGAARLLPVSHGQAAILAADFGVPPGRIRVVNNGVDAPRVREVADGPVPPCLPARYVVVPRRLTAKNGVEVAIRALAALDRDEVDLLIAGDGELRRPLEDLARTLDLDGRVRFTGSLPRSKLFPILRHSLAVVVPSVPAGGVAEPFPLAVLEAMACGAPVIGSALGGIAEQVVDGESGYLVPPGDATALAGAIRRVRDLGARERSSLVARARARVERFSEAAWFARTEAVYAELAHGN